MKNILRRLCSLAMIAAIGLSSFTFALGYDEGMYVPSQIAGLDLKKKGLKIKPTDIYNPGGASLSDAVIRLSIGCTAEFVSPDGLILTNHHCGFAALVANSTPDKDLVETGFNAGSRAGEFPAMDGDRPYSIFITEREEDVTAKVKAGTENMALDAQMAAWKKNAADLETSEKGKAPNGSEVRVQMLNNGYYFFLYRTKRIDDIRFVYAPPRNIGVYGGDPDNFEWTRHTGDFTFLRAYTAPDGSSAKYSPNNVPYKPKQYLTMNIGGLKDNDFVFVMGYPGGTTRYRESWSQQFARDANFPFLAKWLQAESDDLRRIGSGDEEKRIKFQEDIANYDNSRKAFGGGAVRLVRSQVVQQRQAEEARLATWIAANPDRQKKYGTFLTDLKNLSEETNAAAKRDAMMRRFPDPLSSVVFGAMVAAATAAKTGVPLTEPQKAGITASFGEREPSHEREMLKFFFKQFDELPAGQRFAAADNKFENKKGRARREAEAAFATQIAESPESTVANVLAVASMPWSEIQAKHPFTAGVVEERLALKTRGDNFNAKIDHLRLLYMQAITEMKGGPVYPDANSTLRFSYGNIKGYQSREAEMRSPFTTIKGVIEKNTGENPFDAPQKLIDLQNAKDFGRYGEGDSVIVNFLSTTDIIGGNSGSPILNANGQQVGICFDGNYEGLGNDFYYDYGTNRTISVDIRYVLFVTEKFGGAKWIVDEMKVVGKK